MANFKSYDKARTHALTDVIDSTIGDHPGIPPLEVIKALASCIRHIVEFSRISNKGKEIVYKQVLVEILTPPSRHPGKLGSRAHKKVTLFEGKEK